MTAVEYDRLVEIVDGWRCPQCRSLRLCDHSGPGAADIAPLLALQAMLELHQERQGAPISECNEDGQDWPCETIVAAFLAVTE